MKKDKILLIGGGGHCCSVIDVIEQENRYEIAGIVDKKEFVGTKVLDYNVIGCDDDLEELYKKYKYAIVTVGHIKSNDIRVRLFEKLKQIGYILPSIISPFAYVSKYSTIDEGSVIHHHVCINAKSTIGKNCIINTKALIEHNAIIEDNCHISTSAIVNGGVIVKINSFVGSNATIKENINISGFIKAGDLVVHNMIGINKELKAKYNLFDSIKPIKIGYFADGKWSHEAFEKLIIDETIDIRFICVRYDTKDETLLNYCKRYNIDYIKHKNINSDEFLSIIQKYNCDLFVSMSFNQIFKSTLINMPPLKTINCHAGKLPFYRGRNILNWVLINGEKEFGITVHYIDEGIDTGDIIIQRVFNIYKEDNYNSLLEKSYIECANILYDSIKLLQSSSIESISQDSIDKVGFYCSQRKEGDEILKWDQNSRDIFNFTRSISSPGPMARSYLKGKEIKINKIELITGVSNYIGIIGAVIGKDNNILTVKTKDNFINILEYEYDGTIKIGDRFET